MEVTCMGRVVEEQHGGKLMRFDYAADGRLRLGAKYVVYAMALWRNVLEYLLVTGKESQPSWYPAQLFEVSDPSLSALWMFGYYGEVEQLGTLALWGYPEMALERNHSEALSEREPRALGVFLRRKKEIDESNRP
jgi:hypothetical protein